MTQNENDDRQSMSFGETTEREHGPEFYSEIGQKGAQSSSDGDEEESSE